MTNQATRPVALVTGASSGIGRAICLELASRGYDLVVTARRRELLDSLAAEVRARWGRDPEVIGADLGAEAGCRLVEERLARGVDILVANAGFSTRGSFPELPLEREVAEVELNVVATLRLCHAAAVAMKSARRGRILVTSSAASFQPLPGLATYGATKSFLTSFALALRGELTAFGISVSCLAPGYTVKVAGAPRPSPSWMWTTSEEVAKAGVDGLLANRALIVPGAAAKAIAIVAPRLPRAVLNAAATAVARRMVKR